MRWIAVALLGWSLAAAPAAAEAWLTVGSADGSFKIDMPVPFDIPESEVRPDSVVIFACAHQTPELSLRVEVEQIPMTISERSPNRVFVDRVEEGSLIVLTSIHLVDHRIVRLTVRSTPEFEGDPMIHRFLTSVRLVP